MILCCDECSRQYKVDRYSPGQHLRCLCGHAMTVPEPDVRAHQARILHCADCGGPLGTDASQCEYCGGVVDQRAGSYTQVCPKCFARLPETAQFCIECAQRIRPQEVVEHQPSSRNCPRCQTPLQARAVDAIGFDECPDCLGLWLTADAFKTICDVKVEQFGHNPLPTAKRGTVPVAPVTYIKCPDCQTVMNRQNYGRTSGILIDQCRGHGVWLDNAELERIAGFIAEGGLARARKSEVEDLERRARSAERTSGYGSGVMSSPLMRGVSAGGFGSTSFLGVLGRLLDE
jgi:Zn-finger nucleic acid-binding protein/ribosomal protein L40E